MDQKRAVYLDRDGVIIRALIIRGKPYPIYYKDDIEILPGVLTALQNLKNAGFINICVTNQPDVARNIISRETVEETNSFLAKKLPIDRFLTCYHDNKDLCDCRKPLPGLLLVGAKELDIELRQSFMIGDRWRDMEAGIAAGCKTIFIDYGYAERQPFHFDYKAETLLAATNIIIGGLKND